MERSPEYGVLVGRSCCGCGCATGAAGGALVAREHAPNPTTDSNETATPIRQFNIL
jgi:hypothetical protein